MLLTGDFASGNRSSHRTLIADMTFTPHHYPVYAIPLVVEQDPP